MSQRIKLLSVESVFGGLALSFVVWAVTELFAVKEAQALATQDRQVITIDISAVKIKAASSDKLMRDVSNSLIRIEQQVTYIREDQLAEKALPKLSTIQGYTYENPQQSKL